MCLRMSPACSSLPSPKSSTPALLLMVVRFFTPLRMSASIRFSGMPHSPNPPTMIVAPSWMSFTASSALRTTLFMGIRPRCRTCDCNQPRRRRANPQRDLLLTDVEQLVHFRDHRAVPVLDLHLERRLVFLVVLELLPDLIELFLAEPELRPHRA